MYAFLKLIGSIITVSVVLVVILFVATRKDYPVRRLVTENAGLPSQTVAGIKLHLRKIKGPPGADTIIVLHRGPGADFRSLQGLDALSDDYHVVYYDQRGAGLSERVEAGALTLSDHITELEAVIDLVSPDKPPILIGHSWGAILATAYLSRDPEKVTQTVLIEPGFLNSKGQLRWVEESRRYMSGLVYWAKAVLNGFRAQHITGPDPDASDDFLIGQ